MTQLTLWREQAGPPDVGHAHTGRHLKPEAEGVGEGVSTAAAALKAERYRPRIFGFQVRPVNINLLTCG